MSSTFQKLRLVLKFSFKLPDGTALVQRCLEILPVIMESHTGVERVQCCVFSRIAISRFRSEIIQEQVSQKITPKMTIVAWYSRFVETCCVSHSSHARVELVFQIETTQNMWQTFVLSPRKSTKRVIWELIGPKTTVCNILKKRLHCKP